MLLPFSQFLNEGSIIRYIIRPTSVFLFFLSDYFVLKFEALHKYPDINSKIVFSSSGLHEWPAASPNLHQRLFFGVEATSSLQNL